MKRKKTEKSLIQATTIKRKKKKEKSGSFLLRTLGIRALLSMPQEGYARCPTVTFLDEGQMSIQVHLDHGFLG